MKVFRRRVAALLAALLVFGTAWPGTAIAAQNMGHRVSVRFKVLYVGSEFNIGYDYGSGESTTFVCQYGVDHSDTAYNNHTIAISDIQAAANRLSIRSGYEVKGWSKSSSANPPIYPFSGSPTACNKGDTIYIVAKASVVEKSYTLMYHANGGDGAPKSQTQKSTTGSSQFTISSTRPVRTDHEFKGWALNSSDTTAKYQPEGNITLTGDTTLYAVWEKKTEEITYRLKYEANGGIGAPGNEEKTSTAQECLFIVSSVKPTKEGCEFQGWSDTYNGEACIDAGDGLTLTKANPEMILYAVWKENEKPITYTYKLNYDANGGTGGPENEQVTSTNQEHRFTVSSDKPAKEGYEFQGWSETTEGEASYGPESEITLTCMNSEKTLYAVWQEKEILYTITYMNGKEAVHSDQVTAGQETTVYKELTEEHKIFKGWALEEGKEVIYQPGDKFTPEEDVTLYAVWEDQPDPDKPDPDQPTPGCGHDHDKDGYCVEDGCDHGSDCCPKRPEDKEEIRYKIRYYRNYSKTDETLFQTETIVIASSNNADQELEEITIIEEDPSRDGYQFDSWSTVRGDELTAGYGAGDMAPWYEARKIDEKTYELSLYALWTEDESDLPDTPDDPNKPDNPNTPDDSGTSDLPNTPDDPNKPDNPNTPDDSGTSDLPDTPIVPDSSDSPEDSDDDDNGFDGGGSSGGGGRPGGGDAGGGPGTTTETIGLEPVPLSSLPERMNESSLPQIWIDDSEIPLAALPKTGAHTNPAKILFLWSGMLLGICGIFAKKSEE